MLFEDVHWADPTSLELLTLTIERLYGVADPSGHHLSSGLSAALDRAAARHHADAQPAVAARARDARRHISPAASRCRSELLDQIVDRTDGVPLFVEELTKAVLESEQLQEAGDHYVLDSRRSRSPSRRRCKPR